MINTDFCKNLSDLILGYETRDELTNELGEGFINLQQKQDIITNMRLQRQGNLVGDSIELRNNMIAIGIHSHIVTSQAHHLLPTKIGKSGKFNVLNKAKDYGYNIDNPHNGIYLPSIFIPASITGLAIHKGSHPKEYTDGVECLLLEVEKRYDSFWTEEQLLQEIQNVESQIWVLVYHKKLPIRKTYIGNIVKKDMSKNALLELKESLQEQKNTLTTQLHHPFFTVPAALIETIDRTIAKIDKKLKNA